MARKTEIEVPENSCQIIVTRLFDAPREKVWQAWVEPELVKQWLGPRGLEMTIEQWEVRDGGSYRYIHKDENGAYGFHGVFHGVHAPHKIIQTFEFEGMPEPGHVALDTLILEELEDGKTKATTISVFQTVEDRDGMAQSGMEKGVVEGYERLDELLQTV